MRAILIDPKARTITEVNYTGDYRNIYQHIGGDCYYFDCVGLGGGNTLYVDDEGLINGSMPDAGMFRVSGDYPAYLVGKGLILGTDRDGESIATDLTLDNVRSRITFGEPVRVGGLVTFAGTDGKFYEIR